MPPLVKTIEAPPVELNRSAKWPVAKSYVQARKAAIAKGIKVQHEVVR